MHYAISKVFLTWFFSYIFMNSISLSNPDSIWTFQVVHHLVFFIPFVWNVIWMSLDIAIIQTQEANKVLGYSRNSHLLCNWEVHYWLHKSLPHVPVLCTITPIHTPHFISGIFILIFSSILCLGLPSASFPHISP